MLQYELTLSALHRHQYYAKRVLQIEYNAVTLVQQMFRLWLNIRLKAIGGIVFGVVHQF